MSDLFGSQPTKALRPEEDEELVDRALDKAFNRPSTSRSKRSSTSSRSSTDSKNNLRQNQNLLKRRRTTPSPVPTIPQKQEVIDAFTKWTSIKNVVKSPYFPQISDEVVYLRSGHYHYLRKLREKELIPSTRINFKIHKYSSPVFKEYDNIYAMVKRITFETNPFLSMELTLEELNPMTGIGMEVEFSVQYIKLEDIKDFIILRQSYEYALDRSWKAGDRFQTLFDWDHLTWFCGAIVNENPFDKKFPDSHYLKFVVNLPDNTDSRLSPWDLEPVSEEVPPDCTSLSCTQEERLLFYQPKPTDWPHCSSPEENGISSDLRRDFVSGSLKTAIDEMMKTNEGFVFKHASQLYSQNKDIHYMIDLKTISERLQNRFYRRSEHIYIDLKAIDTNLQTIRTNRSETQRKDFEKILKVFYEYMVTDYWDQKQELMMKKLSNQFPESKSSDEEIQEICRISPNKDQKSVSSIATPKAEPTLGQSSSGNPTPVECNTIPSTSSEPSPVQTTQVKSVTTAPIVTTVPASSTSSIAPIPAAPLQTQIKAEPMDIKPIKTELNAPKIEALIDSKLFISKIPENRIESTTQTDIISKIESQTQTQSVSSDGQTQTEAFPIETQIEGTITEKPSLNGSLTQSDGEMDCVESTHSSALMENENKDYLCMFCKSSTYFLDRNQALAHYKNHLGGVIQCKVCYTSYDSVEEFRSLDWEHSNSEQNVNQIKEFYLTNDWIQSFLDFQMTRRFVGLVRMRPELCPACISIKQMTAQTSTPLNAIEDEDSFEKHISRHFKYNQIFECKECNEKSGGNEYKFFFDWTDAENHLRRHKSNVDSKQIKRYFHIDKTQGQKLSETLKAYIDINKSIEMVYESNSFDAQL